MMAKEQQKEEHATIFHAFRVYIYINSTIDLLEFSPHFYFDILGLIFSIPFY